MNVNTTGSTNTAVGYEALLPNTTGSSNTAVGSEALQNLATGTNNIALGSSAGISLTLANSNNIDIGNTGTAGDSGAIKIGAGGTQTTCFIAGINGVTISPAGSAVFVNSNGQLGTVNSSIRYKENVANISEESSPILDLRPVSFSYKSDETHTKQFGLIAEEVYDVFPALVLRGADGQIETVKYHELATLLLNELIKQHAVIEKQSNELKELKEEMNARLAPLEAQA